MSLCMPDPRGPIPTDIDWTKPHELYAKWEDEPMAEGYDLYWCSGCEKGADNEIHIDEFSVGYRKTVVEPVRKQMEGSGPIEWEPPFIVGTSEDRLEEIRHRQLVARLFVQRALQEAPVCP